MADKQLENTKKHSIVDGAGASIMAGAGEQYVIPYAVALGASAPQVGLLSTIPSFFGSVSQLLGLKLLEQIKSRKKVLLAGVLLQTLILIPLFIIPFLTKSTTLLILLFCGYYIAGNLGSPSWNSLIGEVIPADERAAYFARRNKYTTAALFAAVLIAGLILQATGTNAMLGFGVLFAIAFAGRSLSYYHLSKHHEPRTQPPKTTIPLKRFLARLTKEAFGNFVLFRSAMSLAIMVASPFFAVYMLKTQHFDYFHYMIVILTPMIAKILSAKAWAQYAQRFGNRAVMQTSTALVVLVPFSWFAAGMLFGETTFIFPAIVIAEAISGLGWAGFDLTTFNYMLETTTPALRATFFAYFNLIFGAAVLVGGLLGVVLSATAVSGAAGTLMTIFLTSFILRLIAAVALMPRLPEVGIHPKISQRKIFFELFIQRPMGFAVGGLNRYGILNGRISSVSEETKGLLRRHKGHITLRNTKRLK